MKILRTLGALVGIIALGASALPVQAQPAGYPNKPIRLIVPAGSADLDQAGPCRWLHPGLRPGRQYGGFAIGHGQGGL